MASSAGVAADRKSISGGAWWYHALLALVVSSVVWVARSDPAWYESLMQEDRLVEWATVWFFLTAAIIGGWRAIRGRRPFDGLVALFCFFVAGEEFSWGQRLLGVTPPAYFLEHNRQQELTLHNFAAFFGQPKWVLTIALSGYGLLLPLVHQILPARKWLERVGATAPHLALVPWFALAVALLVWYPFDFTGEWVELVAGMLFSIAVAPSALAFATISLNAVLFSALLTWWSGRSSSNPALIACAHDESTALAAAFAGQADFARTRSFHKRVWTADEEERLDLDSARSSLDAVDCGAGNHAPRRRYAVDPWGTAYWIRFDRNTRELIVYSFGPNRRRDDGGDDVIQARALKRP